MRLYAELPGRRAAQVAADLLAVVWVVVWVRIGVAVHDTVMALRAPADELHDAGAGFSGTMQDASRTMARVPVVGDQLHGPFDRAASTGAGIADAGGRLGVAFAHLALVLGWVTALTPIVLVIGTWLVLRWRFVRRASAASRLVGAEDDLDLFALRAMSRQPLPRLAAVSADPVGAWRSGDRSVIRALAALELRAAGLRAPVSEEQQQV